MSDSATFLLPRNGLIWLLAAMFCAIVPHIGRLPLWVTLVCLLCGVWRVMVYRGRWDLPNRWIRSLLVFSGGAAVFGHYGTLAGPEAGSALLILGFCFKLMETHQLRDAFIVVILGYFVIAVSFFFDQSMLIAAYMALVSVLVTAALLGLNQSPLHTRPKRTLKASLYLLGHSLPIMLVLFVLVPRLGPIWSLDLGKNSARTGLSEEINPGDIANLSRSDELAFRVEFESGSAIPPVPQRYWRALVMNHYDGQRWSRGGFDMDSEPLVQWGAQPAPWRPRAEATGQRYEYRVIMEPTDQRWLFALAWSDSDSRGIGRSRDFRLLRRTPVSQPFSYRVRSQVGIGLDQDGLPRWLARINLQLPEQGDQQTRALARQLWAQSSSPQAYIDAVLQRFSQQPFRYTLRPPLLSGDRIDQFLFETQSGFCSHYAGAFVFLMRAAGLPARIVAGYQGGELNPLGGHLLVHQFDAHAWTEVWLKERGWVRIDPTAYVAPERVEQGLEQALAGEGSFLEDSPLSPLRYRNLAWVSQLRLGWDYLNFAWHRLVLGYDAEAQRRLLSRWFERVDLQRIGLLLLLAVSLVVTVLAVWLLLQGRSQRQRDPRLRLYRKLCRKLSQRGIVPEPGEAPGEFLGRAARQQPELAPRLDRLATLLQRALYQQSDRWQRTDMRELRGLVRKV